MSYQHYVICLNVNKEGNCVDLHFILNLSQWKLIGFRKTNVENLSVHILCIVMRGSKKDCQGRNPSLPQNYIHQSNQTTSTRLEGNCQLQSKGGH